MVIFLGMCRVLRNFRAWRRENVENSRRYALRSFVVIILFMGVLMLAIDAGLYYGIDRLIQIMTPSSGAEPVIGDVADVVHLLKLVSGQFASWFIPASAGIFALLGCILWLVLKLSVSSVFRAGQMNEAQIEAAGPGKKDPAEQRLEQHRKQRLFLHFFSVLQREGRLLDFFAEDLSLYDDEQIGAAVRSIQEDCKKAVDKYLSPKPVVDGEEGDTVDIEPGFNPDAIKLTGNVTGEPPFKGTLRHRGWKAGRNEVPRLSDALDPGIIAPAEVEID